MSYLRIKDYRCNYYKRFFYKKDLFNKDIITNFYDKKRNLLKSDYGVLCRLKKAFDGQKECFLTVFDIDSLNRIYECAEPILLKQAVIQKSNKASESNLMEMCNKHSRVYSKLQLRESQLQEIIRGSKRSVPRKIIVITENAECEATYRKLMPVDSVYNMCLLCFPIYEAYSKAIDGKIQNET